MRLCVDHWVAEGWCGVAEEEIYDEQGHPGNFFTGIKYRFFITCFIILRQLRNTAQYF